MSIKPTTPDMFPASHYKRGEPLIDSSLPKPGQTKEAVKRVAGVALAGMTLGATAEVAGNFARNVSQEVQSSPNVQVLEPGNLPEDLPSPEEAIVHITQPGETATDIAQEYENGTSIENLKDKVHNAAKQGEDPGLDPGDRVVIPK